MTVISSRSSVTSGSPVNQSAGTRPLNHLRSFSPAVAGEPSFAVLM